MFPPEHMQYHLKYVNVPSPPQHFISCQMEEATLAFITYLGISIFMGYGFLV